MILQNTENLLEGVGKVYSLLFVPSLFPWPVDTVWSSDFKLPEKKNSVHGRAKKISGNDLSKTQPQINEPFKGNQR